MSRPIHCILLVDDDPDDNFLHQIIINDSGLCEHVRVVETGTEALHYLQHTTHPDYIRPDLILTDVNLPGMNGFEFMEQYSQLSQSLKQRTAVIFLSTSLSPRDLQKAAQLSDVKGYYAKPLTTSMLHSIIDQCVLT